MSGIRTFLVYYNLEDSPDSLPKSKSLQFPEHLWRFQEIFIAEIKSNIPEIEDNFKLKYSDINGEILKVRGIEDFEKFCMRVENADENEDIELILERISVSKIVSWNADSPRIFPSELQRKKCVGNGMHGTVRMALHLETNKYYVIKTLTSNNSDKTEYEKEILAYEECSQSDYVVGYYGCEVSTSKKELVLEYMNRGDLRPYGALPLRVHQSVALSLIRAIRHVWKSGPGYIHRDIKPENILVNSKGEVKICDFGSSKRIDNTYGTAYTSKGTEMYQSPEQRMGHDYSSKVDIWSFGLVILELAIGPNIEEYLTTSNEDICVGTIDNYPDSLSVLISNCLRYNPSDRWNGDQIEQCDYLRELSEPDRQSIANFVNNHQKR